MINTVRWGLLDADALLHALQNKGVWSAGIDVLEQETTTEGNVLLEARLSNLIVTPHIAWSAREARQRALDEIVKNILAFQTGEQRNRVV